MFEPAAVLVRAHRPGADIALIERALNVPDALPSTTFVCVGDEISTEGQEGFLRGHGTQVVDGKLVATVCGVVERINKLIYVKTLNSRYVAEQGDVVVGRVADVAGKAWRVDLKSRQEAKLLLSAVHLPGGIQRRRNAEDELNMRAFFREAELISAEVQSVHADGSVALHTRSAKYGKLVHGQLVEVPPNLIKRQKQHFHTLEALGVELIIGCNGLVWVAPLRPDRAAAAAAAASGGADAQEQAEAEARPPPPPTKAQLEVVCRLANAIRALTRLYMPVYPASIMSTYEAAVEQGVALAGMLEPEFLEAVVGQEAHRRGSAMQE
ncbi:Exosome complex component RRP4 [Tetrabaena socialis]|uniref:Exosome complex component RRP4 n=1 Tax=Tetrabaena socialis TaxID=47790 RepID=A0A2J8AEE1_9CHLO|nr:Exosome complex component RRP4 [Tetrabaena socialis]|eukprot:PNH10883.1 Exosome complex component RRP4 [Tetrabaena socialis]